MHRMILAVVINVLRWKGWVPALGSHRAGSSWILFWGRQKDLPAHWCPFAVQVQADLPLITNDFTGAYFSTSAGRYYISELLFYLEPVKEQGKKKIKPLPNGMILPNPLSQFCLSWHYQALWLPALWDFRKVKRIFSSIQSFRLKKSLQHHGCPGIWFV